MDSCICGRDNVNRWIFSADLTKTYVWYSETGFYIFSESICMRMNFGNYQILYNWAVQKNEKIQQIQKRLNPAARPAQPACGVHVKKKGTFCIRKFYTLSFAASQDEELHIFERIKAYSTNQMLLYSDCFSPNGVLNVTPIIYPQDVKFNLMTLTSIGKTQKQHKIKKRLSLLACSIACFVSSYPDCNGISGVLFCSCGITFTSL